MAEKQGILHVEQMDNGMDEIDEVMSPLAQFHDDPRVKTVGHQPAGALTAVET